MMRASDTRCSTSSTTTRRRRSRGGGVRGALKAAARHLPADPAGPGPPRRPQISGVDDADGSEGALPRNWPLPSRDRGGGLLLHAGGHAERLEAHAGGGAARSVARLRQGRRGVRRRGRRNRLRCRAQRKRPRAHQHAGPHGGRGRNTVGHLAPRHRHDGLRAGAGATGPCVMTVRVVLAEDSLLAREGVIRVLERADDIEIVATCSDATALRRAIEEAQPDVVLTDIRMPPSDRDEGIRVAEDLRTSHPEIGVVVLSHHADPIYAAALFGGGSDRRAYLLKERLKDRGELGHAIRQVAAGGSVVDARIVEELLSARSHPGDAALSTLTPREKQILALLAAGHSNGAIADTLVITKRAVEHHVHEIFFKLDLGEERDVSRRVKAAILYLAEDAG